MLGKNSLLGLAIATSLCGIVASTNNLLPQHQLSDGTHSERLEPGESYTTRKAGYWWYKAPLMLFCAAGSIGGLLVLPSVRRRHDAVQVRMAIAEENKRHAFAEISKAEEEALALEAAENRAMQYAEDNGLVIPVAAQPMGQPQALPQVSGQPETVEPTPTKPEPTNVTAGQLQVAFAQMGHAVVFVQEIVGPSLIQYRFRPNKPQDTDKILKLGTALQVSMGSPKEPLLSIESGQIAVSMPRAERQTIKFSDWVTADRTGTIKLSLGVDIDQQLHQFELNARHLESMVMGGIPGGGKSSVIASMIGSGAAQATPNEIKFAIADGKNGVEHRWLNGSPYLYGKVAIEATSAREQAQAVSEEIAKRYRMFEHKGVSNLEDYNDLEGIKSLPYMPYIVDEFQELFDMSTKRASDEDPHDPETWCDLRLLSSIASLGRAAGIPLILATQRPDRNVIPGQIDGKCAARVAFRLQRKVDSEMVLSGHNGAQHLLGSGDMMVKLNGADVTRIQGIFCKRSDIEFYLKPTSTQPEANRKTTPLDRIRALKADGKDLADAICEVYNCTRDSERFNRAILEINYAINHA